MFVAILQARTGSTRLPNKVLKKIKGKTLLELYINRVKASQFIEKIVVATTELKEDNAIEELVTDLGLDCFRGSENDLLNRYYHCARHYNADPIIRITPDDPFVDYQVIDKGIEIYKNNEVDFVTNHFKPTFPEGLDIEIYSFKALEKSWKEAQLPSEREHVFPYIQNNQDRFKVINFTQENDYSHLRWTIDHQCDFEMTEIIYDHLYQQGKLFLQQDIIKLFEKHPEIAEINSHIKRKEGVNKSKMDDNIQLEGE